LLTGAKLRNTGNNHVANEEFAYLVAFRCNATFEGWIKVCSFAENKLWKKLAAMSHDKRTNAFVAGCRAFSGSKTTSRSACVGCLRGAWRVARGKVAQSAASV
jgi:hypothetical protein